MLNKTILQQYHWSKMKQEISEHYCYYKIKQCQSNIIATK